MATGDSMCQEQKATTGVLGGYLQGWEKPG